MAQLQIAEWHFTAGALRVDFGHGKLALWLSMQSFWTSLIIILQRKNLRRPVEHQDDHCRVVDDAFS